MARIAMAMTTCAGISLVINWVKAIAKVHIPYRETIHQTRGLFLRQIAKLI